MTEDNGPEAPERRLERVTTFLTVASDRYHTAVLTGFYEPPAADRQLGQLSIDVTPEGTRFRIGGPRGYAEQFTGDQLLTELEPGTYTVRADREGYTAATYEAEVRPRRTTTVSIALQEGEDEDDGAPEPQMVSPTDGSDTWATLQVQTFEDLFGGVPAAGSVRIRVVHVSPTSPSLLVIAQPVGDEGSGAVELGTLSYPAAGAFATIPAGRYTLRFQPSGSDRSLAELQDVELVAGAIYTFFLTSEPSGARPRVVPTVDAAVLVDMTAP